MNKKKYKLPAKELRVLKVGIVYLYGSVANDNALEFSDIDIGIVFTEPGTPHNSPLVHSRLYDIFDAAVKPKREIDLVFLQRTSLALQYNVINEGKIIYEVSPEFRANYEGKVLDEYLDFMPVSDFFDACLIERLR